MNQRSFASAEYAVKKKHTRREKFQAEMEGVVPWARLTTVIDLSRESVPDATTLLKPS